ncbi:hypothetical protein, partial [Martelella alba]
MNDKQKAFEEFCKTSEMYPFSYQKFFEAGYDARNAEVAELKKQLAENQAFFDGLHDAIRPEENKSQPIQAVSVP